MARQDVAVGKSATLISLSINNLAPLVSPSITPRSITWSSLNVRLKILCTVENPGVQLLIYYTEGLKCQLPL